MSRNLKIILFSTLAVLLACGITMVIVYRHAIAHRIALHEGKSAIAQHIATPVDLNDGIAQHGWSAENFSSSFRWQAIPTDFQVFNGVPFQINGAMFLWGSRFANAGWAKQIPVPVHQKFQTLYLLHCAFYISPTRTPVYQVVFHYDYDNDVAPVTNTMLYGIDVLDWYTGRSKRIIGPRSHNARLAWVGGAFSEDNKSPLILCLTAVSNPVPNLMVTSIDLNSCQGQSGACIFGITTGKAGLMK